jgi:hypothetical protein
MIPATKLACALLLATALASPAFAAPGDAGSGPTTGATKTNDAGAGPTNGAASANTANTPGNPSTGASQQGANAMGSTSGNMHVAQKMRDDLTKAGFTDIHIMPSSFLVRAKDSSGNPVMMVINPDSITAITEEPSGTNAAKGSTRPGGNSQPSTPGAPKTP